MPRFKAAIPMRWNDMDAYGHVNNVVFLTYLEEARIEMFAEFDAGPGQGMLSQGVVVARSSIEYLRPLVHRHDPLPIDVWCYRIGGASFHIGYEVHDDERGEAPPVVYARASSVMVPYDFAREVPRRLSPVERDFLRAHHEDTEPVGSSRVR